MPKPPELPAPFVEVLDGAGFAGARALATLGLSLGEAERVLAWSDLADCW
jgi:hypothetical protein